MLPLHDCREEANIFGHLVDSKRDKEEVSLVVTPYNHRCYNVTNLSENESLSMDMHITTRTVSLCFPTRNLPSHAHLFLVRDPPLSFFPAVPLLFALPHS